MVSLGVYGSTGPHGVTWPHLKGIRQHGYQSNDEVVILYSL